MAHIFESFDDILYTYTEHVYLKKVWNDKRYVL